MSSGQVHVEWGASALSNSSTRTVVIIDVLSFSTCVSIASERGASVVPTSERRLDSLADFADRIGAKLANHRSAGGLSLSPNSLNLLQAGDVLILPSPNGATLSETAKASTVIAGCLRNGSAVAKALAATNGDVLIVPAGERWDDGSMRVAVEDYLGASAIASMLAPERLTSEAALAARAFEATKNDLRAIMFGSVSAKELVDRGFPQDIEAALEQNVDKVVPVLGDLADHDGVRCYRAA